jgi:iron complex outermembrane receptor protein
MALLLLLRPSATTSERLERLAHTRRLVCRFLLRSPLLLGAALVIGSVVPVQGQARPADLSMATLEELLNIQIISASRKDQRAEEVPAAVYIITHEDIRRSGMSSVPALLRLVPGVQVARINSNKWAVSARGFNSLYSNKLLVLVDGRSVYNPLFSSVLWDTEDLMLEDVERIEVIRGPGAAVWGANAVNGVINILTRSSADTGGWLVRGEAGNFERDGFAIRYGGPIGTGTYRLYAQLSNHGDSRLSPGVSADDHWKSLTGGFRGDWAAGSESFMLQSSATSGQQRPLWRDLDPAAVGVSGDNLVSTTQAGDLLGRWVHTRPSGATLEMQSFADAAHRRESIGEYHRFTGDIDAIYHAGAGRHDFVVGGGYRYIAESIDGGAGHSFNPSRTATTLLSVFAQDEISLLDHRGAVTLGTKLQHENSEVFTVQPTARVMWRATANQHVWAAISRALRTPSLVDRGVRVDFPATPTVDASGAASIPVAISVFGSPATENERLVSTEAGYRLGIRSRASVDVAGFVGRYQGLQTTEPSSPTVRLVDGQPIAHVSAVFQNLLNADTRGVEIAARLMLTGAWQLDGAFSAFHLTPHPDPASHDPVAAVSDGSAPGYEWSGHSAWSLGPRLDADVRLFYTGALVRLGVDPYTRVDARLEWKVTPMLSLAAVGQNLFRPAHAEFASDRTLVATQVPRSGSLRLTWRR